MVPEARTARLLLRPLELADAPQIQALFPQWEIVKYLAAVVPWPYPPDGSEQHLREKTLPAMEAGDSWSWTIRPLADPDRIIGRIDLYRGENENRGFWLDPVFRRRGLMTEACNWATDFWFEVLGFERMRVPKAAANLASRRISEKQGMRLVSVGEKDYVCGRLKSEIWEITAEEWRAWKAEQANRR
ncbi:MAG TPA: GNAT family N-acetyltransferase [Terracidiphilus sp.]|jgi:RimJ/RimL family protein N-acetyltransferase|nr:GNAT family N-acetyltransferase [Terracidiphilus sp.]